MSRVRFANRWNLDAIEAAYQRWQQEPASVDESWRFFFEGFELGADANRPLAVTGTDAAAQAAVIRLIQTYRDLGHFLARLDPLSEARTSHPQLELDNFDLEESQLERIYHAGNFLGLPQGRLRDIMGHPKSSATQPRKKMPLSKLGLLDIVLSLF